MYVYLSHSPASLDQCAVCSTQGMEAWVPKTGAVGPCCVPTLGLSSMWGKAVEAWSFWCSLNHDTRLGPERNPQPVQRHLHGAVTRQGH